MKASYRIGVLGGTFDPIHYGHLAAAEATMSVLQLNEVRIVPAHDPPHRQLEPKAGAFHRFALVALAIQNRPGWRLSDAEVTRAGPSYTAHTLRALHATGYRPSQIVFILGADAFAEIATWFEFPAVLDDAHFAVVARAGTPLLRAIERTEHVGARIRSFNDSSTAFDRAGTGVFLIETTTPDVSSTEIRRRLAAGLSIDDLVPPAVARYIDTHNLYGAGTADGPRTATAMGSQER